MRWKTAGALAIASGVMAVGTAVAAGSDHRISNLDQLNWGPAPPSLPQGAEAAVMSGDPTKKGTSRSRYVVPRATRCRRTGTRPTSESPCFPANFTMGMGDRLDTAAGTALTAGGYAMMPRRTHHWAAATSPFVIQIQAMGPFDIHYINPADDPMNAKR